MNSNSTPTAAPMAMDPTWQMPTINDNSQQSSTTTLKFPRDAHPDPHDRDEAIGDGNYQAFAKSLHQQTVGDPSRPETLRGIAKHSPSSATRKAAELLLKQDEWGAAADGLGGYQWINGELRWGSGSNHRRLVSQSGSVHEVLPGSVQVPIASSSYTLQMCNGWLHGSDGGKALGLCCGREHRIFISNAMPAPNRIGTVWHEIMHACWFEMDYLLEDRDHSCETWCNVTEKAMGGITPLKYAEIIAFVTLDEFAYPADPASE